MTVIHYALDEASPPVFACETRMPGAKFSPVVTEVTCPDCIASEYFPRTTMLRMQRKASAMRRRATDTHEFKFTVKVRCETRQQAERVMGERIFTDADYGFPYEIWVMGAANDPGRGE